MTDGACPVISLAHILVHTLRGGYLSSDLLPALGFRAGSATRDESQQEAVRAFRKLVQRYRQPTASATLPAGMEILPLAFLSLALSVGELLPAFIDLVQHAATSIFGHYFPFGSDARREMCKLLRTDARFSQAAVALEARECEPIVRQHFFWSPTGMQLFGGDEIDAATKERLLIESLEDATSGHPVILRSFVELALKRAGATPAEMAASVRLGLNVLLSHLRRLDAAQREGDPRGAGEHSLERLMGRDDPSRAGEVLQLVRALLEACARQLGGPEVHAVVLAACRDDGSGATSLLEQFAAGWLAPGAPHVAPPDAARTFDALCFELGEASGSEQAPTPGLLRKLLMRQPSVFAAVVERRVGPAVTRALSAHPHEASPQERWGAVRALVLAGDEAGETREANAAYYATQTLLVHLEAGGFPGKGLDEVCAEGGRGPHAAPAPEQREAMLNLDVVPEGPPPVRHSPAARRMCVDSRPIHSHPLPSHRSPPQPTPCHLAPPLPPHPLSRPVPSHPVPSTIPPHPIPL